MMTAIERSQIVVFLCLMIALSSTAYAQQPRPAYPKTVWMVGSDIGEPSTIATHQLRDALEAVIGVKPGIVEGKQDTRIYIPEFVRLEGRKFTYKVLLTDSQLSTIRSTTGGCETSRVEDCARAIVRNLTR